MTRTIALCALLSLASCAAVDRSRTCRAEAGPKPYAAADMFGVMGVLAANQDPERHSWEQRVNQCIVTKMQAAR